MLRTRKTVVAISPQSVSTGATATGNIDCLGYRYVQVDLPIGTAGATTAFTTLKISDCDTTVVTSFADVVALTGGTSVAAGSTGFVIAATGGTATGNYASMSIVPTKRYLKVSVSPGTTVILSAVATLSRAVDMPDTATEVNAAHFVQGQGN